MLNLIKSYLLTASIFSSLLLVNISAQAVSKVVEKDISTKEQTAESKSSTKEENLDTLKSDTNGIVKDDAAGRMVSEALDVKERSLSDTKNSSDPQTEHRQKRKARQRDERRNQIEENNDLGASNERNTVDQRSTTDGKTRKKYRRDDAIIDQEDSSRAQ